jgi:hypothetical protein
MAGRRCFTCEIQPANAVESPHEPRSREDPLIDDTGELMRTKMIYFNTGVDHEKAY